MVKKSLSDLLQEEAQKFTPNVGEPVIEVSAQAIVEPDAVSVAEEITIPTSEAAMGRRSHPTKADLEVKLKQLQLNLEQAKETEKNLQQTISNLQATLAEQETVVERLKKELYDAKKAALQLAQENSKLIEENNSVKTTKQEPENPKPVPAKAPAPYNPLSYRKSYRPVDRQPQPQPKPSSETPDDFAANTWLYD
jgi:DNA repair exonuclease SbcCD ATPase subunit